MASSQIPRRIAEPHPFDPLLCASLHNEVIAILKPFAEEHNNRVIRNFFVAYGHRANAMRGRLSEPIITFLENIEVLLSDDAPLNVHFTPHLFMPYPLDRDIVPGGVSGSWDEELWLDEDCDNWVVLYQGKEQEHNLYFNMDLRLCTWQQEVMPWMRNWYPLDRALRLWLSYRIGKFRPSIGQDTIYFSESHRRYIPSDLDRDLKAYHDLLSTIQARCPGSTISEEPSLVDAKTLTEFYISGFVRDFLLQARRPSFTYIAPGLRVPSSEWIQEMLSQARMGGRLREPGDPENNYDSEPLPLFPGPKIILYSPDFENWHKSNVVNNISGLTAGLITSLEKQFDLLCPIQ